MDNKNYKLNLSLLEKCYLNETEMSQAVDVAYEGIKLSVIYNDCDLFRYCYDFLLKNNPDKYFIEKTRISNNYNLIEYIVFKQAWQLLRYINKLQLFFNINKRKDRYKIFLLKIMYSFDAPKELIELEIDILSDLTN